MRADECDPTRPGYMTPAETAWELRVSPGTLANWRSLGKGPPWVRVGGRVVYAHAAVVAWARQQERGAAGERTHEVNVTARPYNYDKTRQHVNISFDHPLEPGKTYRKRIVAPAGMDNSAAVTWGEKQAREILRDIIKTARKEETETQNHQSPSAKIENKTFADLWRQHEEETLLTFKKSTQAGHRVRWRVLFPLIGDLPVDLFQREQIKRVQKALAHYSVEHYDHLLALLRTLLDMALEEDLIDQVPRLKRKKVHKDGPKAAKQKAHGAAEIERLLIAARKVSVDMEENLELVILLGLDGGLRPGEVAGLRWTDVDLEAGHMTICNNRPGDYDTTPKGGEEGLVYLTKRLARALADAPRVGKYVAMRRDKKAGWKPNRTQSISHRVAKIHAAAGLPVKRGHFLRHVSASTLIGHGATLGQTKDHLRHQLAGTTEKYIRAVSGLNTARQAAAILDDASRSAGKTPAKRAKAREIVATLPN